MKIEQSKKNKTEELRKNQKKRDENKTKNWK